MIKDFKGFYKALERFREDPTKFTNIPKPPKAKKLRLLMNFSAEGNVNTSLVGALNILRVGAKLLRLGFYENLKILFIKLCNPVRLKLMELFFKVTPESLLGIGGSSGNGLSLRTVESNHLNTFCS